MAENSLALEEDKECSSNSDTNWKNQPGQLSTQMLCPRHHLSGLLLQLARANPRACNHVLQAHEKQKGFHVSQCRYKILSSTHRITQTAEVANCLIYKIGYTGSILSCCKTAISTVAELFSYFFKGLIALLATGPASLS